MSLKRRPVSSVWSRPARSMPEYIGVKATLLGCSELLIVLILAVLTAADPALLDPKLILDQSHSVVIPLTEIGSVGKADVRVTDSLVRTSI